MIDNRSAARPLPVVLPALQDELLLSWIRRHAAFYGVGVNPILRHCRLDVSLPRQLDLALTTCDQHRLGDIFRCGAAVIRGMTQARNGKTPEGPIATVRPMQVCNRCASRHRAADITRGARLRSWMEGWRMSCPVCGTRLEDARPMDMLTKVDVDDPLLARTAVHARMGERLIDGTIRKPGGAGLPLIELMRILLLPRPTASDNRRCRTAVPRLLDVVVPGFDQYLEEHYPHYRSPGSLLLAMAVRVPVLAGVGAVVSRPDYWVERLLGVSPRDFHSRLIACIRSLPGGANAPRITSTVVPIQKFSNMTAIMLEMPFSLSHL